MRKVIFIFSIYCVCFNKGFAQKEKNADPDSIQYTVEYFTGPRIKFDNGGFIFSASATANLNASSTFLGVEATGGYIFNPILYAGIGLGFSTNNHGTNYTPLFVEGQVNLLQGRFVPYVGLQIGGCFRYPARIEIKSGEFFFSPAIGLRCVFWKSFICFLSVGYRFQSETQYFYINEYYSQIKVEKTSIIHELALKLGIYF